MRWANQAQKWGADLHRILTPSYRGLLTLVPIIGQAGEKYPLSRGNFPACYEVELDTAEPYDPLCQHSLGLGHTEKRANRAYKTFHTNLEIGGECLNELFRKKNLLKVVILYQRNLCIITGGSTRTHISRKHLETSGLTLRGKNDLINIPNNILKNGKLEGYSFKMAWLNNLFNVVGKKSQLKKMEQLQIYFKNSHKYRDTRPPLAYITPETNLMLKVEESYFQKSQETLETILVLRLVKEKIVERKKPTEIRMLQKKKYTNNMDSVLSSIKERKFSKQSTNIYNKNQHRIFFDEEALNIGRKDRLMGFKKYGQQQRSSFLRTEMVTVQERKTTKKSVTENQKFPFPFVFTYQRSSNSILKIFLAHNTVLSNIEDKPQFAKIKFFRNRILIRIQGSILQAKKSKSDKNGLDVSSKIYNMELSVINQVLSSITSAMGARCELLSSQVYTCKAKSTVYMMERLKHLMIVSQRAHFLFNTAQKGFRISVLKRQMARKHHDTKESLPTLLYLHKHAFQGPSVIERTKRSTKDERVVPIREQTVPISVSKFD